jgi:hypothetical protein
MIYMYCRMFKITMRARRKKCFRTYRNGYENSKKRVTGMGVRKEKFERDHYILIERSHEELRFLA